MKALLKKLGKLDYLSITPECYIGNYTIRFISSVKLKDSGSLNFGFGRNTLFVLIKAAFMNSKCE